MEIFRLFSYSTSHIFLICYVLMFIKWRYSALRTIGTAVVTTLCLIGLELVRYVQLDQGLHLLWTIVAQILLLQTTTLYLSEYRDFRGLFTGLSSSNYVLFGNLIARIVYSVGVGIWLSTVTGALIHAGFLVGLLCYLRPSYMEVQRITHKNWFRLCLIPLSFYLALLLLMQCLSGSNLLHNLALLCVLFTIYLAYVLLFQMIYNIYKDERVKREREMMEMSMEALKRIMEEVQVVENRIAIARHDQRHLARTLQALMEKEDYEAVKRLLNQDQDAEWILMGSHYCDNVAVNGVICYYARVAENSQIRFEVSAHIPETIPVNEWELAVAIGNLLDNAVQAASEVKDMSRRMLRMTAKPIRNQILIEILNDYEGDIAFDPKTTLPISANGEGHGIGLRSVTSFAECNQGLLDYGVEGGQFFVRLLV